MTFRVFSGPQGAPDPSPLEKRRLLYKEFMSIDEALSWASHLRKQGRVALAIEGDDGTQLDRREIGAAIGASSFAPGAETAASKKAPPERRG